MAIKRNYKRRKNQESKPEDKGPFIKPLHEGKQSTFFSNKPLQAKLRIDAPNSAPEQQADKAAQNFSRAETISRHADEEMQAKRLQKQEEEEPQAKLQRAEEEEMQTKLQWQEEEEVQAQEEEEMQTKLQRQEEEEVQTHLQRQGEEEEVQAKVQRKPETSTSPTFESTLKTAKTGGFPLAEDIRNEFEAFFGKNLKHVRIHTDDTAVQLCKNINAQAFTHGSHIFFNKGKFAPETSAGKHLLAHELTHVIQQGKDE